MTTIFYKELSYAIIGAAMEVHTVLGPGFLESVYQTALAHEFQLRGISFEEQKLLPVSYKGIAAGNYVADFCVEDKIIVEIKAITKSLPVHEAQAVNYLAATGFRLALLINFGRKSLEHKRLVR
jgi:GxxExxY protein